MHLCKGHVLGREGCLGVVFSLLACLVFAGPVAHAQTENSSYTLRERASTNRMDLFRTRSTLVKGHGLFLDDKHRVKLYEDNGWMVMSLQTKQRAPGGPNLSLGTENVDNMATIRYEQEYDLMRIGAEVMAPAPPNYVKNPGRRYRIYIEGLAVAPLYKNIFEVDAANALDAVATEFHKLSARGKDLEIPAIEFGGLLAMRALNESGFLPARIPLTVLRSKVGQIRIQGQYFERGGKLLRLPRFGNVMSGQVFNFELPDQSNALKQHPNLVHGPTYRRGQGESQVEPLQVKFQPFHPEKSLVPKEVRANQFGGSGTEQDVRERFVGRTKPLTHPERQMETALATSERKTFELLGSPLANPLEARATAISGASFSSGVSSVPQRRSGITRAGAVR